MDVVLTLIIASVVIIGLLGIALNSVTLIALHRSNITSPITSMLLQTQCVIDLFNGCLIVIYKLTPNDLETGFHSLDVLLCHLWSRDNLFWLGYIASVHNLVCISFDRMVAVVWPLHYRSKQSQLISGCFVYLTVIAFPVFIPNCFLRRYRDGACLFEYAFSTPIMLRVFEFEGYSWLFSTYLFPAFCMVGIHVMIIRIIQRREKNISRIFVYPKPVVENNTRQRKITFRKQIRNLTVTTVAMAATSLLLRSWETVIYIITHAGFFPYANGTARQQIGVLLSTIGSVANPCILTSTNRQLRVSIMRCLKYLKGIPAKTRSESGLVGCRTGSVPVTMGGNNA